MNIFVENNKSGIEHMLINRAIIKIFQDLDKGESKIFCSKSLFEEQCLSDFFRSDSLKVLTVFSSRRRFFKLFSELYFFLRLLTVWRSFISDVNNHFIFTSLYPTSHFFVRYINRFFICKVTVVLHSEVSFLYEHNRRNVLSAVYWMKKAFRCHAPLINYIVLGDHIDVDAFISKNNVVHINHPIESDVHNHDYENPSDKPSCVGHIGLVSKLKRSHLFFELSDKFRNDSRIRFVCAGSVSSELRDMNQSNVEADFSGCYLSNKEMDALLRQMSFSVFTYGDLYSYVASGAILEAIRYGIPILCLRNSYFSFLQESKIIFFEMYDDVESMAQRIEDILDSGLCMKTLHAEGLDRAREYFSFDASLTRIRNFYG